MEFLFNYILVSFRMFRFFLTVLLEYYWVWVVVFLVVLFLAIISSVIRSSRAW